MADRRAAMTPVVANREVYELIRDGVPVEFDDERGRKQHARVRLIDFENALNPANQFLAVSQLWVQGEAGFDVPTLSTLYLDKPQKDHTLMQTIGRANRVTSWKIDGVEKKNGEIVDYYGVFRNMKKALRDYAQGQEGGTEMPVQPKDELFRLLDEAIAEGVAFCRKHAVRIDELSGRDDVFKNIEAFESYANVLLAKDELRKTFAVHANAIESLYEACKPEILGRPVVRSVAAFQYLRGVIDSIVQQADIEEVVRRIGDLLDASVVVDKSRVGEAGERVAYAIKQRGRVWDLSKIDFDKLKQDFRKAEHRNIEISDLRAFLEKKVDEMLKRNVTRKDFAERLRDIIERYNAGGATNEAFFDELVKFTRDLKAEDERHAREGLTEDELEIFDLLKKEKMTQEEEKRVKLAAKSLLERLTKGSPRVLVQEWFRDTQSKERVAKAVQEVLDDNLPESYDRALFKAKCDEVFGLVLDHASHGRKWAA